MRKLPVVNCFNKVNVVGLPNDKKTEVDAFNRDQFIGSDDNLIAHIQKSFDHDLYYVPYVLRTAKDSKIYNEYCRLNKAILVPNNKGQRPLEELSNNGLTGKTKGFAVTVEYLIYDFDNKTSSVDADGKTKKGEKQSWSKLSQARNLDEMDLVKSVEDKMREIEEFEDAIFCSSQNGFRAYIRIETTEISYNDYSEDGKIIPELAYHKVHSDLGYKLANHLLQDFDFCDFDTSKSDWYCFFAHPRIIKNKVDDQGNQYQVDLRSSYVSIPENFGDKELSLFDYCSEDDYLKATETNTDTNLSNINKGKSQYQDFEFDSEDKKETFYKSIQDLLRKDPFISQVLNGNIRTYGNERLWFLLAMVVKASIHNNVNLDDAIDLWKDICKADPDFKNYTDSQKRASFDKLNQVKASFVSYATLLKECNYQFDKSIKLEGNPLSNAISKAKKVIKPKVAKKVEEAGKLKKINGIELVLDAKGNVIANHENIERIVTTDSNIKKMMYFDTFKENFRANSKIRLIKNGQCKDDIDYRTAVPFTDNTYGIISSYISLNYNMIGASVDSNIQKALKTILCDIKVDNKDDNVYDDYKGMELISYFEECKQEWKKKQSKHYNNFNYSVLNTWLPEVLHIDPVKHPKEYNLYGMYGRVMLLGFCQRAMATTHAVDCQWIIILRGTRQSTGKSLFASKILESLFNKKGDKALVAKYINNAKESLSNGVNAVINNIGRLIELHEENAGNTSSVKKADQAESAKLQKSDISTSVDNFTFKMKNEQTDRNRTFIKIANTNELEFLFDDQNRRHLVIDLDIVDENNDYIIRLLNTANEFAYQKKNNGGNEGNIDFERMFDLCRIAIGEAYCRGVLGEDKHLWENRKNLDGSEPREFDKCISYPQLNTKTGRHNHDLPRLQVENNQPSPADIRIYDAFNSKNYIKKDSEDEVMVIEFLQTDKTSGGMGNDLFFASSYFDDFLISKKRNFSLRKIAPTLKRGFTEKVNGVEYKITFIQSTKNNKRGWQMNVFTSDNKQVNANPFFNSSLHIDALNSSYDALSDVLDNPTTTPIKDDKQAQIEALQAQIEALKKQLEKSNQVEAPKVETPKVEVQKEEIEKQVENVVQIATDNFSKLTTSEWDEIMVHKIKIARKSLTTNNFVEARNFITTAVNILEKKGIRCKETILNV